MIQGNVHYPTATATGPRNATFFIHVSFVGVSVAAKVYYTFLTQSPSTKSISGSVQERLSSLPSKIILRLNVTSETRLNRRSLSSAAQQPRNIPHAMCRTAGCPFVPHIENDL